MKFSIMSTNQKPKLPNFFSQSNTFGIVVTIDGRDIVEPQDEIGENMVMTNSENVISRGICSPQIEKSLLTLGKIRKRKM